MVIISSVYYLCTCCALLFTMITLRCATEVSPLLFLLHTFFLPFILFITCLLLLDGLLAISFLLHLLPHLRRKTEVLACNTPCLLILLPRRPVLILFRPRLHLPCNHNNLPIFQLPRSLLLCLTALLLIPVLQTIIIHM